VKRYIWERQTKTHFRLYWWGLYLMAFAGWLLTMMAGIEGIVS
jgi:hypothetical protein